METSASPLYHAPSQSPPPKQTLPPQQSASAQESRLPTAAERFSASQPTRHTVDPARRLVQMHLPSSSDDSTLNLSASHTTSCRPAAVTLHRARCRAAPSNRHVTEHALEPESAIVHTLAHGIQRVIVMFPSLNRNATTSSASHQAMPAHRVSGATRCSAHFGCCPAHSCRARAHEKMMTSPLQLQQAKRSEHRHRSPVVRAFKKRQCARLNLCSCE